MVKDIISCSYANIRGCRYITSQPKADPTLKIRTPRMHVNMYIKWNIITNRFRHISMSYIVSKNELELFLSTIPFHTRNKHRTIAAIHKLMNPEVALSAYVYLPYPFLLFSVDSGKILRLLHHNSDLDITGRHEAAINTTWRQPLIE